MYCTHCASLTEGRLCDPCTTARKIEAEVRRAGAAVASAIDAITHYTRTGGLRHDFDFTAADKVLTTAHDTLAAYRPTIR